MHRSVEPEWLDELPPQDEAALRSRRDLRRVNRLMAHVRLLRGILKRRPPPRHIVELGAGDGTLLLRLLRRLAPRWEGGRITLIDRADLVCPETRRAFEAIGWKVNLCQGEVIEVLETGDLATADLAVANLFLHHFDGENLARLLRATSGRARSLVAMEPRRSRLAWLAAHGLGWVGCNAVTRHDAVISVRAGFRPGELSSAWPATGNWRLQERRAGCFSHLFLAEQTALEADG